MIHQKTLADTFNRIVALVYPDLCQVCRNEQATAAEGYVCGRCWSGIEGIHFIAEPFCRCCGNPFEGEISSSFECSNCRDQKLYFRSARAAVKMTGLMKEVIHKYKYNQALWFEPFLGGLFGRSAVECLKKSEVRALVPIPLHWKKKWERSFNQSERLANLLSAKTGIPVYAKLLKRIQPTPTQTRLTRAQRMENVKGAFVYNAKSNLNGGTVVLIDDVLTTGATASECAKVLMRNGASSVDVWTVARGTLQ